MNKEQLKKALEEFNKIAPQLIEAEEKCLEKIFETLDAKESGLSVKQSMYVAGIIGSKLIAYAVASAPEQHLGKGLDIIIERTKLEISTARKAIKKKFPEWDF